MLKLPRPSGASIRFVETMSSATIISALRRVLLALTVAPFILPQPAAGTGSQATSWAQLEIILRNSCNQLRWSKIEENARAEALFNDFVRTAERTLRKDDATTDDVNKAGDQLVLFCRTLEKRARTEHPKDCAITIDDFLAVKRTSSYPFDKEAIDEAEKLAFELAFNFVNSLLVVTTGILALSITFRKDLVGAATSSASERWLMSSWVIYLASIVAGIITMMGLIGPLNPRPHNPQSFLFGPSVVVPQIAQLVSFAAGTACFVLYGLGAWVLNKPSRQNQGRNPEKKAAVKPTRPQRES